MNQQLKVALVKLPSADELGQWVDLLGTVCDELINDDGPVAPARGTQAAAERALKLQAVRLWLLGAMRIRVSADAGQPVGNDPDALPA